HDVIKLRPFEHCLVIEPADVVPKRSKGADERRSGSRGEGRKRGLAAPEREVKEYLSDQSIRVLACDGNVQVGDKVQNALGSAESANALAQGGCAGKLRAERGPDFFSQLLGVSCDSINEYRGVDRDESRDG